MPIEIKELHIKINVDEGSSPKEASSSSKTNAQKDKTTLIAACVEAVLEILEQQKER